MASQPPITLIAAAYTPLSPQGRLNMPVIETQAAFYQANGLDGVFLAGTNGEGKLLTLDERKALLEMWLQNKGRLRVFIQVGTESFVEAQSLAAHAEKHGADAVALVPPVYYKPDSLERLIDWCSEIAHAAPNTPFYYYHIPTKTGLHFPMRHFLELGQKKIPTLQGLKFSHDDLVDLLQCLHFADSRFDIYFGRDEMLLAGLALGVKGAVGSTYNFASPLYRRMIEAFYAHDWIAARQCQLDSQYFVSLFHQFDNEIGTGKAILKQLGVDCGPLRKPLHGLTPQQEETLASRLKQSNAFSSLSRPPRQS